MQIYRTLTKQDVSGRMICICLRHMTFNQLVRYVMLHYQDEICGSI